MKIKPKEVKRRVGILTDPQPTYVSIVDHGANQTPFNSVKRDRPITSSNPATKEKKMTLKAGKGSTRKPVVTRLTFSKSLFASEQKVSKYLETKGYDSVSEVQDGDDVWFVTSTDDVSALKLDKPRSTATKDAGVTAFIAEIIGKADEPETTEDEEDGEEGEAADDNAEEGDEEAPASSKRARAKVIEPAKKAAPAADEESDDENEYDTVLEFPPTAEGVTKFDWWASYMSDEGDLRGVLADGIGYDDVPPGVDVLVQAAHWTMGNIFGNEELSDAEKKAKLAQMGSDLADLAYGLYDLFSGAIQKGDKSSSAKRFSETFLASVEKAQAVTLDLGNVTKTEAPKPKKKAAAPAVEPETEEDETGDEENGTDIEAIIAKALAPVTSKLTSMEARLKTVGKTAAAAASRQPTKKSLSDAADDLIDPATSKKQETDEEREARLEARKRDLGGAFGYTPGARSGS